MTAGQALNALRRQRAAGEPTPHLYIRPFLDPADYDACCRGWPEASVFATEAAVMRSYPNRRLLRCNDAMLARLPGAGRQIWNHMRDLFMDPAFAAALIEIFSDTLGARLDARGPGSRIEPDMRLVEDDMGYSLGPHTDATEKLISALVYLPDDDAHPTLGTAFYRHKDPNFRCPGGPHYARDGFALAAAMPYQMNALLAFPKTDRCFHGVETLNVPGYIRRTILWNLYLRTPDGAP